MFDSTQPITIKNYINGTLIDAHNGSILTTINPSKGTLLGTLPDSDEVDVATAYQAAAQALAGWKNTSVEARSEIMYKIAALIDAHQESLALAESLDNGKPISLARRIDIPRAAANMRFFAQAITQFASESHHSVECLNYTLRQPIGVVACISPWNLPLYLFTWKIAPALASGNCVIAKPSEVTPLTAYLFSTLCIEAGLPPGVLNVVHGLGHRVGEALVKHHDIKAVSFTGGTATGKNIASIAAPMFKKLSLELGGKNATIIFEDCDFDEMIRTTVQSSFSNQGEICLCGSRIYIERPLYEKFKKAFVEKVKNIKVGNPLDAATQLGAIVSKAHFDKINSYIVLATTEGGTLLAGGISLQPQGCENGYYIAPTVFENLACGSRINTEEIFGPVVTLQPFDTEEEVIAATNASAYGLATCIWTNQLKRAHRLAACIDVGIVWINCWLVRDLRTPFGGMKQSGIGREGGLEALRFFTEPKNVCIKL